MMRMFTKITMYEIRIISPALLILKMMMLGLILEGKNLGARMKREGRLGPLCNRKWPRASRRLVLRGKAHIRGC